MLEKMDFTKSLSKEEYKEKMNALIPKLSKLQRDLKEQNVPAMIAFEGYDAAGKGAQIAELMKALDPRGFEVYAVKNATEDERMHPFLWRFWKKMPAKGRIGIYDSSWYRKVLNDQFEKRTKKSDLPLAYASICSFEKQLADDGMILIKIFLAIDQKEQAKRFEKLLKSEDTAWRVTKEDLKRNRKFEKYQEMNEEMLAKTNQSYAPWTIIEAQDRRYATVRVYETIVSAFEEKLKELAQQNEYESVKVLKGTPTMAEQQEEYRPLEDTVLDKVDLSLSLSREEYDLRLKELQKKIKKLHGELYRRRIPVVLGFEGWDAGGKGGAIKRLTEKMDPRGYVVHPTASPNAVERQYHYLWRFWNDMPKDGHVTIFDRTWYGRVMVERIEGFCSKEEWKRAYQEMNDMEKSLSDHGAIVIKFWLQIDKDEQENRFKARMENPEKQYKITDEDWRNREKWDKYEEAVNEMLVRTSTSYAPWVIVEGNDKLWARIKVLETVVNAIEERLS